MRTGVLSPFLVSLIETWALMFSQLVNSGQCAYRTERRTFSKFRVCGHPAGRYSVVNPLIAANS
jgi:hypothetical protein